MILSFYHQYCFTPKEMSRLVLDRYTLTKIACSHLFRTVYLYLSHLLLPYTSRALVYLITYIRFLEVLLSLTARIFHWTVS